ncbi:MAG TPA: hypothetical protein VK452_02930 [Dissulfurispiraceae bacterium]|nr:hypothetical protein [Dissulfurispiraceae bacterium]
MIVSILIFGLLIFTVTFLISKRSVVCERSEIATYLSVIAWGSMVFGLYISRFLA